MSETAELIPAELSARHETLMSQYIKGVAFACISLYRIREEKTYKAIGLESFSEFLRREGISAQTGRLMSNSGPVFELLVEAGEQHLVKHVDIMRPIYKMLVLDGPRKQEPELQRRIVEKQATILRIASKVAERRGKPVTERLVSEVAEKNYGWLPASKRQAEMKRERERAEPPQQRKARELRESMEDAFVVIGSSGLTGFELRQILGKSEDMLGFDDALQVLNDWRDAD